MAIAFIGLPIPLPLPTAIPTPNVPGVIAPKLPGPAGQLPAAASPAGQSQPTARASAAATPQATANPTNPPGGIVIPFTAIYVSSPLDLALVGALATLPLLFGIWLLLFGRTFAEARRARDAQVRLMLAADLGLRPRDLASMSTRALFNLREKSAFDELTGALRRAAGVSAAEREIARARRHNSALTVAFVDLDGLKEANDQQGLTAGDALLRGLAQALRDGLRAEDVLFRYGGDEFVCVMPDTPAREARAKLGSIQSEAARSGIRFCAGVAQLRRSDDVVSLFARADRDLYDFKANRGEIVQFPPPGIKPRDERSVTG